MVKIMPFTIHDLPYMVLLDNIDLPNFGNLKFRGRKFLGRKFRGRKFRESAEHVQGGESAKNFRGEKVPSMFMGEILH